MSSKKLHPPQQKKRRKTDDTGSDSDSDLELEKGQKGDSAYWAKWIIIEAADETKPLSGLSPFAVAKGIKALSGEPKSVKRLRSGSLLVECHKEQHSRLLLRSPKLVDRPVRVYPHKHLNSSKGVMRCRDLRGVTEEEIKTELEPQGVTDVHRVFSRRGKERVPTDTFFVTFCRPTLPDTIKVGYLQVKIDLYIPSPLRCFKCQKFGHVRDRCREEEVCATCSKVVHQGECQHPALCVNCGGSHPSSDRTCPTFVMEKEIQKVKTERRITFFEARKIVQSSKPQKGHSYSDVVRNQVKLVSTACQTDLFRFSAPAMATERTQREASGGGMVSTNPFSVRRSSGASVRRGSGSDGGKEGLLAPTQSPCQSVKPNGKDKKATFTPSPRSRGGASTGSTKQKMADKAAIPSNQSQKISSSKGAAGNQEGKIKEERKPVRLVSPPKTPEFNSKNRFDVLQDDDDVDIEMEKHQP